MREITGRDVNWKNGINLIDPDTGLSPLMLAAIQGKLQIATVLIERGADIEFKEPKKGRTALQIAARCGQLAVMNELLKRDSLVNGTDKFQKTPLMHASKGGYVDCVKSLIARGASVNMTDENGFTPLHYAARYGHQSVISVLVDYGAAIEIRDGLDGKTALHWAAQFGRKETVIALLDQGAKINRRSSVEKVTALMLASREGYKSIVSVLIQRKADVNMTDIYGWTALHFASSWGRRDTAHILIVEGLANINARDVGKDKSGGITSLIVAAKGGHLEVMRVLLHYGADVNLPELIEYNPPLHCAAILGLADVMQCLIDYGANINLQNEVLGTTALMLCCKHGRRGVIIVLLNHLADLNILDKKGLTALEYASANGFRDVLLSAIVHISPAAKANVVPWLELECPNLVRNSMYGGPSVYMTSVLYRRQGLYYGLYQLTGDCDVYLIYCLVMIAAGCQQALLRQPKDRPDLLRKIAEIDLMLEKCISAQQMCIDSVFNDCFVVGRVPCEALGPYDIKYFASAFTTGPLALYIDHEFSPLLSTLQMREKTDAVFYCCLKDVGNVVDGFGENCGHLLRLRYCPYAMLLFEGLGDLIYIGLVVYYTSILIRDRSLFSLVLSHPFGSFTSIEAIIALLIAARTLYEIGLMEEKRWKTSPSIIFHFRALEKFRYQLIYKHFVESVWKICDLLTLLLGISWIVLRLIARQGGDDDQSNKLYGSASQLLLVSCIPASLGLLRYPSVYYRPLAIEMITIVNVIRDMSVFLLIYSALGLGFGVTFYAIFRDEVYDFHSPVMTLITLFNAILKSHDDTIFDVSSNRSTGLVIGAFFLLLGIIIFFNGIIGSIAANYSKHLVQAEGQWELMKCKIIQQHLLVQEKSALSMLPPPFNLIPVALYFPHVYYIWRARLALEKRVTISLAGQASDILLHLLLLLPAACVEYVRIYLLSSEAGYVSKLVYLLFLPLGILYTALCLLFKLFLDPFVKVILKSRLSDGRLRISYNSSRDFYEAMALSRFEDQRLFQDLEQFAAPLFYKDGDFELYRKFVQAKQQSSIPVIDRGYGMDSHVNQLPLDHNLEDYRHKSLWRIVMSSLNGVWRKRGEDYLGRKIRIAPTSPYLQLANIQNVEDLNPPGHGADKDFKDQNDESLHNELSQEEKDLLLLGAGNTTSYFNPADPSAHELAVLPGNNSAIYASEYDPHNTQIRYVTGNSANRDKPGIWWVNNRDSSISQIAADSKYDTSAVSRPMVSPYQPGILNRNQWDELAGEHEPRNSQVKSHGISLGDKSLKGMSRLGIDAGETQLVKQALQEDYESTVKKISEEIHLPTNEESLMLAAPSLYFHTQRFPPIFRADERKKIFEEVLPDIFRDDFTHAIESSERNLHSLESRMQKLERLCDKQTLMLQHLLNMKENSM